MMTQPANPTALVLSDAEWGRLTSQTQNYVRASFELLDIADAHLRNHDLRQASEMGWGAAAQIVKAVAENWNLTHRSHRDLRALVYMVVSSGGQPTVEDGFDMAQNLHHNFYENDASEFFVILAVHRVVHFVDDMLPWLRNPRPPRATSPEQSS